MKTFIQQNVFEDAIYKMASGIKWSQYISKLGRSE